MSQFGSAPPPDPNDPSQQPSSGGYGQQPGYGQYGTPGPSYGQPMGSPPNNYLVPAILTTLFCCLPLGVVSIVFAAQVNSKYSAGDVAGAQEASEKAKKFAIWSAIAGVIVIVLYIIFVVALGGLASMGGSA